VESKSLSSSLTGQPLDKYLIQQFYETIPLLHLSEQTLLLVLDLLNHLQERKPCTDVIEPLFVEVIRSCIAPISVANVGWYPTADGIRPKVPKPQNLLV
jgi:hypothetical protein